MAPIRALKTTFSAFSFGGIGAAVCVGFCFRDLSDQNDRQIRIHAEKKYEPNRQPLFVQITGFTK